jgi:hypothetical protein
MAVADEIRTDISHSARIWNYWMGGLDNYAIDRQVGDASLEIDPDIAEMVTESRKFLIRAVSHVTADVGIRQFLDIGTGLPTMQNTHEVAQGIAPDARIVYVDNDPLVLTHGRTLLTGTTDEGVTTYVEADFNTPEQILERAGNVLNLAQPVGVMFMGVLGHVQTYDDLLRIVHMVLAAVPPGSHLVYWDDTTDSPCYVRMCAEYAKSGGVPYIPRTQDQLRAVFDGLDLLEPGFGKITHWRRPDVELAGVREIAAYGGVARKP